MRRFRSSVFHGREENFCMHENRHNAPREKNKTEKRNRPLLNCHVLKKKKEKKILSTAQLATCFIPQILPIFTCLFLEDKSLYPWFRHKVFLLAFATLHTGRVCVCEWAREGGREGDERKKDKGETKGIEAKNTPKIHQGLRLHLSLQCDLYHPITAGRIKWQVRAHRNRILLTLTQDMENLIWKREGSYCDRKSMECGWYSAKMTK